MLFTIPNSKDSDWTTFESVQPLFALELPWQVPQADGIEAIKVDTFIQCFSADMKIAPSLLPKHGLSRNDFQAFSETLLELLGFLESLVRVNVLEPTRQENENQSTSVSDPDTGPSVYIQSTILDWLQAAVSNFNPSLGVTNSDPSLDADKGTFHQTLEEVGDTQERERFPRLRALGKLIETSLSHGQNVLDACYDFLAFQHSLDYLQDGQHKASSLNACMQSLHKRQHSPRFSKSKVTIAATQWANREPWNTSARLFSILHRKLSSCVTHCAMLRLNGFELEDLEKPATFNIFLSSCKVSPVWKQSKCISVPKLHKDKGEFITDMCGALRADHLRTPASQCLRIKFDTAHLWDASNTETEQSHVSAHPAVSLKSLLDDGFLQELGSNGAFKTGDKAVLALSLARCILHLFQGPWMQRAWDSDSIQFLKNDNEELLLDIHSPYIKCSLSKASSTHDPDTYRAIITSFARTLLEIEIGRTITVDNTSVDEAEEELKETLYDVLEDRKDEFAREHYNDAVEGCLQFDVLLSMERTNNPGADLALIISKVLYKSVVVHLEKNMGLIRDPLQALAQRNLPLQQRITTPARDTYDPSRSTQQRTAVSVLRHIKDLSASTLFCDRARVDSLAVQPQINVLMDDSEEVVTQGDSKKAALARTFLSNLATFNSQYMPRRLEKGVTRSRICIIDTGLNLADPIIRGFKRRIIGGRSWVDDDTQAYEDTCGHGTHIARLLLATSAHAEILIAKVSKDKVFVDRNVQFVPLAIEWAIANGADIISLSLGFRDAIPEIQAAIHEAISPEDDDAQPMLIFAAAGNWGLNYPRAFPSNAKGVFCIFASDGNGYRENINPSDEGDNSFSTLGIGIESSWQGSSKIVSGTSFATPVAVGMAANVLDFARSHMRLGKSRSRKLASYQGMRAVLRLMTPEGRSVNYLCPWQLGVRGLNTNEQIAVAFKEAIDLG